jgi:hypothetical protein
MRSLPGICCLSVCVLLSSAAPSRAAFHDWRIKEIFSSADGTVQFIEFFTPNAGQQFLDTHTIDVITNPGPGQSTMSFMLNGNLTVPPGQSTANRHFLVATAGFGALAGGVAPNYFPLPANFINLGATNISISFAHGADSTTFAVSLLPKDGVNSLTDTVTSVFPADTDSYVVTLNSPTNFSNASGSVNVGTPTFLAGDFDENRSVAAADLNTNWRGGFGMAGAAVDHNDGDADDDNDVDGGDFLVWQQQLGQSSVLAAGGGVPEPATGWLATVAVLMAALRRRHSDKLARV